MMLAFWLTIIGLIAGLLAGLIRKGSRADLVGYVVVGLTGSVLGGMIFNAGGLSPDTRVGEFIAAAVGAIILMVFIEVIKKV